MATSKPVSWLLAKVPNTLTVILFGVALKLKPNLSQYSFPSIRNSLPLTLTRSLRRLKIGRPEDNRTVVRNGTVPVDSDMAESYISTLDSGMPFRKITAEQSLAVCNNGVSSLSIRRTGQAVGGGAGKLLPPLWMKRSHVSRRICQKRNMMNFRTSLSYIMMFVMAYSMRDIPVNSGNERTTTLHPQCRHLLGRLH